MSSMLKPLRFSFIKSRCMIYVCTCLYISLPYILFLNFIRQTSHMGPNKILKKLYVCRRCYIYPKIPSAKFIINFNKGRLEVNLDPLFRKQCFSFYCTRVECALTDYSRPEINLVPLFWKQCFFFSCTSRLHPSPWRPSSWHSALLLNSWIINMLNIHTSNLN